MVNPFDIGIIEEIYSSIDRTSSQVKMNWLYRPEQTKLDEASFFNKDLTLVYWTGIRTNVDIIYVQNKCEVVKSKSTDIWSKKFYFDEFYDVSRCITGTLPPEAEKYVSLSSPEKKYHKNKLKGLDIFAGAGGFSVGLEESGIIETKWAIEWNKDAANTYKSNHQETLIFVEDSNVLLKKILDADKLKKNARHSGQNLPKRGEVDVIFGGPPCRGRLKGNSHYQKGALLLRRKLFKG